MQKIKIEELQEKQQYLIEYEEMADSEIEAMPQPFRLKRSVRKDYQLITIDKIELPFYVVSIGGHRYGGKTVIRFSGNENFYIPSKEFLAVLKKEKRCPNCC